MATETAEVTFEETACGYCGRKYQQLGPLLSHIFVGHVPLDFTEREALFNAILPNIKRFVKRQRDNAAECGRARQAAYARSGKGLETRWNRHHAQQCARGKCDEFLLADPPVPRPDAPTSERLTQCKGQANDVGHTTLPGACELILKGIADKNVLVYAYVCNGRRPALTDLSGTPQVGVIWSPLADECKEALQHWSSMSPTETAAAVSAACTAVSVQDACWGGWAACRRDDPTAIETAKQWQSHDEDVKLYEVS